ncbi:isochorismatase family cysteine hydrolase [Phenylobacterium sp.]|jgi:nicotinamidase-related amidase|uniref:cysteine hydrolase family protein n=1 Tax=Phenylobacterium sp. TaxID=1871053 RepID=UPI002F418E8E
MSELALDAARSALLVMDLQTRVLDNYADGQEALLAAAAGTIAAARGSGLRVIYVVAGFRPGFPEISPRNKGFSATRASGFINSDVHPQVAPAPDDIIVTKHRVGAFTGTDLDMILRSNDIDTLVLSGVSTSGVVLSTLRHAADSDYRMLVLRDCCSDRDREVHACLLDKVFPRQALVTTSSEMIQALTG